MKASDIQIAHCYYQLRQWEYVFQVADIKEGIVTFACIDRSDGQVMLFYDERGELMCRFTEPLKSFARMVHGECVD